MTRGEGFEVIMISDSLLNQKLQHSWKNSRLDFNGLCAEKGVCSTLLVPLHSGTWIVNKLINTFAQKNFGRQLCEISVAHTGGRLFVIVVQGFLSVFLWWVLFLIRSFRSRVGDYKLCYALGLILYSGIGFWIIRVLTLHWARHGFLADTDATLRWVWLECIRVGRMRGWTVRDLFFHLLTGLENYDTSLRYRYMFAGSGISAYPGCSGLGPESTEVA